MPLKNRQKTSEEFKSEIAHINPNIILLNEYKNARTRMQCKCKVCNHEWTTSAYHLQQGTGCEKCAQRERTKKQTLTQEEFVRRMNLVNPNIEVLGNYVNAHKKVEVKCKKCNHIWNPSAWDILQGNGCPNCFHNNTSYFENYIFESFKYVLGADAMKKRDRKTIGKELDIYIPSYRFAIEPGAWHWHKNKVIEDQEKVKLCKDNAIDLIIIYDGFKGDDASMKNTITYKEDLGVDRNEPLLKDLVIKLFQRIELKPHISDEEWKEISNRAYLSSRKMNTEDFEKELYKYTDKFVLIGEYTGYNNKVKVKCRKCGHIWGITPGHIFDGRGCPKCAGHELKTNDQFIKQLKKKQPTILPLEKYINSDTKIKVKCLVCGEEWYSKPANLLHGYGCKKCGFKKTAEKNSKAICQYDLKGQLISTYKSLAEAQKKTGILKTSICNVTKGKSKTAGGFVWKYKD